MNKQQALQIGRNACSIFKRGTAGTTDWTLSRPWRSTDPRGPTTHVGCGYYRTAQRRLALAVADVAMEQMLEGEDRAVRGEAYDAMHYAAEEGCSARNLLNIGLKAAEQFKAKAAKAAAEEAEAA